MKNIRIATTLLLLILLGIGCDRDTEPRVSDTGYLISGHFYGECMGEGCVEIFRLETTRLLEDTTDTYPHTDGFYEGSYVALSNDKFLLVKDLPEFFPDELLNNAEIVIGQPDAGDWGGLYIEYNYEGVRKYWLIDQMDSNTPAYLHDFVDEVNQRIALINQ